MKKFSKILLIIILIIAGVGGGILVYFYIQSDDTVTNSGYVRIYVNSSIYSSLTSEINRYEQDLEIQGYNAEIVNWSDPIVENLKADLVSQNSSFKGAILVGKIPYALYFNGTIFPCDLYLMDLDGTWSNPDGDNVYDLHSDGGGDIFPEIWIGRIDPEILNNLAVSHLQAYKDYFNRNHAYRTGALSRPNSALLYVD
ncbi:MAG: hypothetical protein EU543_00080, partial [Promethearchaeota archaeon]